MTGSCDTGGSGPVPDALTARRKRFVALDSLRGVAAVGVMFYHFGDFGLISAQPLLRAGNIFVDFFFVLSGFVIAAAYGRLIGSGFSRLVFLALRVARVYPLHIAVVAAFALAKLASGRSLFEGAHGMDYLLRAVFLLDGFFPDDSNFYSMASWSISVEMVAYLLAALLLGRGRYATLAAVVIWSFAVAGYVAHVDLPGFGRMVQQGLIGFGMGAATWWLWSRWSYRAGAGRNSLYEMAAIVVAVLLMSYLGRDGWRILLCDLSFVAVVFFFARDQGSISGALASTPMQALGRWFYSIYLTHPFIINVWRFDMQSALTAMGYSDRLRGPGHPGFETFDMGLGGNTALTLVVAASVIAFSALTFRFIEEPARNWAKHRVGVGGSGANIRIGAP